MAHNKIKLATGLLSFALLTQLGFSEESTQKADEKTPLAEKPATAKPSPFQFQEPVALTCESGNIVTTGTVEEKRGYTYASAHFADLNGDNKKDILTGDIFGGMRVYLNISTDQSYKFAKPKLLRLADGEIATMKNW